jgi:spore maturation protein CgeB
MALFKINKNKYKILHIGLCASGQPYNALQMAFINNCMEYREVSAGDPQVNQKAVQIAETFFPDIVFIQVQNSGIINTSTVIKLKQLGAWVCNWTGDVRTPIPKFYYELGQHIDVTLFTNMTDVKEMRSNGYRADYLEIGFDQTIFNPKGQTSIQCPIIFMGNNYGNNAFPMSKFRVDMVGFMQEKFKKEFTVYGGNWNNSAGDLNNSQIEEATAYRGSKIAINVSHFEYERYSSDRLLRILGSGTPICLAKYYPGMEIDFTDGVSLRTWETLHDLENLCKYYLDTENESERAEIANNGSKLAHQRFTFDCMIKNLLKLKDGK